MSIKGLERLFDHYVRTQEKSSETNEARENTKDIVEFTLLKNNTPKQ